MYRENIWVYIQYGCILKKVLKNNTLPPGKVYSMWNTCMETYEDCASDNLLKQRGETELAVDKMKSSKDKTNRQI